MPSQRSEIDAHVAMMSFRKEIEAVFEARWSEVGRHLPIRGHLRFKTQCSANPPRCNGRTGDGE